MRRYIVLLLITGTVWAQTDYDKLVKEDGTEILGEYLRQARKTVHFRTKGAFFYGIRPVPINQIKTLKLKDGTIIISDGKILEFGSAENLKLDSTTEQKAINDAKKDAKKWLGYTPLALLSSSGLATASMHLVDGIKKKTYNFMTEEEVINLSIIGGGILGFWGTHHLLSKLENKNIEGKSAENFELYEKTYSKQLKNEKFKNIIICSVSVPALGLAILGLAEGSSGGYSKSPQPPGPW